MERLALLLLSSVLLNAADTPRSALTITAENVRNAKGVVGVLVFRSANGWPEGVESAVQRKAVPAHEGEVTISFDGLEPGTYAVVVLHDENENMRLDRNWLGKPREGWGMSNNPKPFLSAPSFESAKFSLSGQTRLPVHLQY